MPTNEQRRKAAKRKLERQNERRRERVRRRRRTQAIVSAAGVVVLIVAVVTIVVVTRSGSSDAPAAQAAGACTYTPEGAPSKPATAPDGNPPRTGTVSLNLATSQGAVPLTLDRASAPCAVNAVASLAQQGFYDDTPCHRLTTGEGLKVLQCGDPTGQGNGGPGFAYGQEPLPPNTPGYTRGVVAMANTGQPNSTGSQFFLVYGDSQLPPDYSVVGKIDDPGLAVLDKVAAAGDDGSNQPGDGKPKLPVQIQRATLAAPVP